MGKRRTSFLLFIALFLCVGCSKTDKGLSGEQTIADEAKKIERTEDGGTKGVLEVKKPTKLFEILPKVAIYTDVATWSKQFYDLPFVTESELDDFKHFTVSAGDNKENLDVRKFSIEAESRSKQGQRIWWWEIEAQQTRQVLMGMEIDVKIDDPALLATSESVIFQNCQEYEAFLTKQIDLPQQNIKCGNYDVIIWHFASTQLVMCRGKQNRFEILYINGDVYENILTKETIEENMRKYSGEGSRHCEESGGKRPKLFDIKYELANAPIQTTPPPVQVAQSAAKPPIIETNLTRETARQLIQSTAPNKFSEMNDHTKARVNLERDNCTTQYLENLKKEGIVMDVKFGKSDPGYRIISYVEFAPQWQSFFDVTTSYFRNYTSVTGWSYMYLDLASARVVGIKQKGEQEATAEVEFAPNKLFEVSQKYECTRKSTSWFNFKYRAKFELWDDGWRITSIEVREQ